MRSNPYEAVLQIDTENLTLETGTGNLWNIVPFVWIKNILSAANMTIASCCTSLSFWLSVSLLFLFSRYLFFMLSSLGWCHSPHQTYLLRPRPLETWTQTPPYYLLLSSVCFHSPSQVDICSVCHKCESFPCSVDISGWQNCMHCCNCFLQNIYVPVNVSVSVYS